MGFFDGLLGPAITQTANARGAYRSGQEQAQQQNIAQLVQLRTLKQKDDAAAMAATLNRAQIGHLNAETDSLTNKSDFAGHVFDQDGTPYIVHKDGTMSRATIREATPATDHPAPAATQATPAVSAVADTIGDSQDMGGGSAATTPPAKSPTPYGLPTVNAAQPTPKFGPRAPNPSTIPGTPEWLAAQDAAAKIRSKYRAEPQQTFTPFQGTDPTTGKPVVRPFNTKTGQFGAPADVAPKGTASGGLAAPMAAKVGQYGEMLKKASDLMPAMDALDVKLSQSAANDIATHGLGVAGMHIPGTKGLGAMLTNKSPEYATYEAALSPFVLATAHALSGARINQDQVAQIERSIKIQPGESPQSRQQKVKNLIDLVNSIGGSLPSDAIDAQEAQMDPTALEKLRGYGYVRKSARGPAPAAAPVSSAPSGAPASGLTPAQAARAKTDPEYAAFLKATGKVP